MQEVTDFIHQQLQGRNHRRHFAVGANYFWLVNSYDYLKPNGICIVAPWMDFPAK